MIRESVPLQVEYSCVSSAASVDGGLARRDQRHLILKETQHGPIHRRLSLRERANARVGTAIPGRHLCLDCRKHHGALFHPSGHSADEIDVNVGALDAPGQLMPTYESWIVRRESWLPPCPLNRRYDRDRDAAGRLE